MDILKITTVEMHTAGEPLRIVTSGLPVIAGNTILEKIRYLRENHDDIRKLIMLEPRGHSDMFGVYLIDADIPGAEFGCIFIHNEGYSTMCGHAVISLGRYAIDYGIIQQPTSPETRVLMQCPCGPVEAFVEYKDGRTGNVRFKSVPSFLYMKDVSVELPDIGEVFVDICYGGAFYAFIEDYKLGMSLKTSSVKDLTNGAAMITESLKKSLKLTHPDSSDLAFLYGTIIVNSLEEDEMATLCVFADRQVDRSPCGSGCSARMAQLFSKGLVKINEARTIRGAVGSKFVARVVEQTKYGHHDAVIVEVSGKGHYLGKSVFTNEDDDVIGKGFLLR
ncbi:Trans-L-3-hydroxyproline dehydratase [Mactra antiquata]